MTESAYRDISFPQEIQVVQGEEEYENIGPVKTHVYVPRADALLFLDMPQAPAYDSAWHKAKNSMIKRFNTALARFGLKKTQFTNLPEL